jgi:hypothetical protein
MSSRGTGAEFKAVSCSLMAADGGAAVAHHLCQFTGIDWRVIGKHTKYSSVMEWKFDVPFRI